MLGRVVFALLLTIEAAFSMTPEQLARYFGPATLKCYHKCQHTLQDVNHVCMRITGQVYTIKKMSYDCMSAHCHEMLEGNRLEKLQDSPCTIQQRQTFNAHGVLKPSFEGIRPLATHVPHDIYVRQHHYNHPDNYMNNAAHYNAHGGYGFGPRFPNQRPQYHQQSYQHPSYQRQPTYAATGYSYPSPGGYHHPSPSPAPYHTPDFHYHP